MGGRKQLKGLQLSPRRDRPLVLAIVGVFFTGMTAGCFIFAHESQPQTQTASGDGKTALGFFFNGTRTIAR